MIKRMNKSTLNFTPEEIDNMSDNERSRIYREELTGRTKFKFEIGVLTSSSKVLDMVETTKKLAKERDKTPSGSFGKFFSNSFIRHCLCDWGDISQEDRSTNDRAVKTGGQLFSSYIHHEYPTICILTESDRSKTTVGLAKEFHDIDRKIKVK
jgi:hypothetical protein